MIAMKEVVFSIIFLNCDDNKLVVWNYRRPKTLHLWLTCSRIIHISNGCRRRDFLFIAWFWDFNSIISISVNLLVCFCSLGASTVASGIFLGLPTFLLTFPAVDPMACSADSGIFLGLPTTHSMQNRIDWVFPTITKNKRFRRSFNCHSRI